MIVLGEAAKQIVVASPETLSEAEATDTAPDAEVALKIVVEPLKGPTLEPETQDPEY